MANTRPMAASLEEQMGSAQSLLEDKSPSYVLVRFEEQQKWVEVTYVPDTAMVTAFHSGLANLFVFGDF